MCVSRMLLSVLARTAIGVSLGMQEKWRCLPQTDSPFCEDHLPSFSSRASRFHKTANYFPNDAGFNGNPIPRLHLEVRHSSPIFVEQSNEDRCGSLGTES